MRIRLIYLIVSIVYVSLSASSQIYAQTEGNAQLRFDQAGDLLNENKYLEAMDMYRSLERDGYASGPLFLNMGIISAQQDSLGLAKYYFLKASGFDDFEEDALEGLAYVESRFSRQSAVLPKLPWERALEWMNLNIGAVTIFVIGLLILTLGILLVVLFWLKVTNKTLLSASYYSIPLGLIVLILAFYVDYQDTKYAQAIMISEQTNVVESALNTSRLVSLAYEGYSFTIDQHKSEDIDGWSYVRMSNGLFGWIESQHLKVL